MSELRLVGNHISDTGWNFPIIGAGHFQVVYDTGKLRPDGKPLQYESEVLSSNNGEWNVLDGHWEYWPKGEGTPDGPPRDHINYTPEHPERDGIPDNDTNNVYEYSIIHEGVTADSAWTILEQVNDQFNVALDNGHQIPYNWDYNSNSYATTLLYAIGVDINDYAEGAKPPDVSRFPGQGENALLDPEDAISLNLQGTAENDIIRTGLRDDTLDGGDGHDKLYGGPGNDILSGGWGFDLLDGGEGEDTADYSFYVPSDGLKVDLGTGEVSFSPEHSFGSPPLFERLVSIENVIGGGGNDTLISSTGDNILTGGEGRDQFTVLAGNDTITDMNFNEDSLFLPSSSPIRGSFLNGRDTVLTHAGGTVTLADVNLSPEAGRYPWLEWAEDIFWGTLGGQQATTDSEALLI